MCANKQGEQGIEVSLGDLKTPCTARLIVCKSCLAVFFLRFVGINQIKPPEHETENFGRLNRTIYHHRS